MVPMKKHRPPISGTLPRWRLRSLGESTRPMRRASGRNQNIVASVTATVMALAATNFSFCIGVSGRAFVDSLADGAPLQRASPKQGTHAILTGR